jgi:hypothetical protein
MALTTNTQIKQSDMAALAALANAKPLDQSVTPMYNDPSGAMWGYQIPASIALNPASLGTHYKAGDIVTGPTGESFTVGTVGPNGELLGLVQVGGGTAFPYSAPGVTPTGAPPSPYILTGGSGSGAQVTFVWLRVGPNKTFAFPEWYFGKALLTAFTQAPTPPTYVNQGVTIQPRNGGYSAGDVLSVPGFTSLQVNITAVDSTGTVTGYTITDPGFAGTTMQMPTNAAAMPTTGGTGTGFMLAALYTVASIPAWAAELARLRLALYNYFLNYGGGSGYFISSGGQYQPILNVSGASAVAPQYRAWPIASPNWANHNLNFWFRDTGHASSETVTISSGFPGAQGQFRTTPCYCQVDAQNLVDAIDPSFNLSTPAATLPRLATGDELGGASPYEWTYAQAFTAAYPAGVLTWCANALPSGKPIYDSVQIVSQDYELIVGGVTSATLTGTFVVYLTFGPSFTEAFNGNPKTIDSGFTPDVSISGNFPGSASSSYDPSTGYYTITWTVNQSITPGNYTATVTVNNSTDDHQIAVPYYGSDSNVSGTELGPTHRAARWSFRSMTSSDAALSLTISGAVPDNGIDNSLQTYRISVPDSTIGPAYVPFGLYGVFWFNTDPPGTALINAATGWPYFANPAGTGQFQGVGGNQFDPWTNLNSVPTTDGALGMVTTYSPSKAWQWYPFPQPVFLTHPLIAPVGWGVTTSTPGLWTGQTGPVNDLLPLRPQDMPWNLARTKEYTISGSAYYYGENPMLLGNGNPDNIDASNTYDQGTPAEFQSEPAQWVTRKWITAGFTVGDSHGGGLFQCQTAGYTGSSEPAWNITLGSTTVETPAPPTSSGSPPIVGRNQGVSWTCVKVLRKATTWAANTQYAIGSTIIDGNGNTQQAISGWVPFQTLPLGFTVTDANNNQQTVTTAGKTGATTPAWGTSMSATTTDGTVTWTLAAIGVGAFSNNGIIGPPTWPTTLGATVLDFQVLWKLVTPLAVTMTAAKHRYNGGTIVPRYPYYWASETIARLKIPSSGSESAKTIWGCGNQWQRNSYGGGNYDEGWSVLQTGQQAATGSGMVGGSWVYSIAINRISTASGSVSVTIGCMRSGSFVSFGAFATGQKIIVLWPIFTSDALVYQCSERVDIQAVVIGRGGQGVTVGLPDVNSPIATAFYNDTLALVGLM